LDPAQPSALQFAVEPTGNLDLIEMPIPDRQALALEDDERDLLGLPPRFALPHPVLITPDTHGTWEFIDQETLLWRLRISAPQADSLNLGFTTFALPEGARVMLYSVDFKRQIRPFTAADNDAHGELWTPVLLAEEAVLELTVPSNVVHQVGLVLTHIGYGYRGFGVKGGGSPLSSGSCNIDVVCPEGDLWPLEIGSVGVYSRGGSTLCTGFMVNNTANDRTPYFMTAAHCGVNSSNDSSVVVYWNYETSICDGTPDGQLTDFNTGSVHRASYSPSDFTLVELDDDPDPSFGVTFSGWDRSGASTSAAVAIHQPNTDEKRISFEDDPTATTSYLGNSSPGDGSHLRVLDWDLGTTEPGSSGSPLYDPNHRVIGQLHGGYAACGNDLADWYGKVSVSWNGGGSSSSRLKDWLDPGNTGAMTVDSIGIDLLLTPGLDFLHSGPVGGPFSNPAVNYTLENRTAVALSFQVSLNSSNGLLLDGGTAPVSGTLAAGTSQVVTVSVGSSAQSLIPGSYVEFISFEDQTNSVTYERQHTIEVGRVQAHLFAMDTNPGWTTEGQWSFGSPSGSGGQYGLPDPTSGHTGSNVCGYNLSGDYANNLPERSLTTTALDCTGLNGVELRFWRWLNVEQPLYDHAYLRVSTNGTSWTTIWENATEITDSSWQQQTFDLSAIADNQATVYLRWVIGTTDGSWQYSGWNIDDVSIWGTPNGYFLPYGTGCLSGAGFLPELSGSGNATPGGTVSVSLSGGEPFSVGLLYLAGAPDLSGSSCLLLTPPLGGPVVVILGASGAINLSGPIPAGFPSGLHTYLQYVQAGYEAWSNGLDLFIE
jgi:hypothetical protein